MSTLKGSPCARRSSALAFNNLGGKYTFSGCGHFESNSTARTLHASAFDGLSFEKGTAWQARQCHAEVTCAAACAGRQETKHHGKSVSDPPVEVSQVVVVANARCCQHALHRQARHNVDHQPSPAAHQCDTRTPGVIVIMANDLMPHNVYFEGLTARTLVLSLCSTWAQECTVKPPTCMESLREP